MNRFNISSSGRDLIETIGNKLEIENWKFTFRLPDDQLSIENAIIMS